MEFTFVIPQTRTELCNSFRNNYCVAHVLNPQEIPEALKRARDKIFVQNETFYIFDHFDTFFSLLECAEDLQIINLIRAYDLLYKSIDNLGKDLVDVLALSEIPAEDRLQCLNAIKMLIYLMEQTVRAIDKHMITTGNDPFGKTKGRGKGKDKEDDREVHDWDNKRQRSIIQLFNLLELPLEKLWEPPICEESFVNLVCEIPYRTLQQSYAKQTSVCQSVFQILGKCIKKYNHAMAFPTRIVNILESSESSINAIATGVHLLHNEFGITTIIGIIIRQLVESVADDTGDSQKSKHFSLFLTELCAQSPKLMIAHLPQLCDEILSRDSYVLRNCVLQMLGEVIITELTSENLSEEMKETRDEFLDPLLEHILDVSAHVRSKVLQIWHHMKSEQAIPLSWQFKVLEEIIDRLQDKALLVRKNAIALLIAFLEHNPFAAKFSSEELKQQLEPEQAKLQELREKINEASKESAEVVENWDNVVGLKIVPVVSQAVDNFKDYENLHDDEKELKEKIKKNILDLIAKEKFKELVDLIIRADFAVGNEKTLEELNKDGKVMYIMMLVRNYHMMVLGETDLNDEYQKQENTVNFLIDKIKFSDLVTNAVPKLEEMLMSKSNSDVFEAIDFFTTAYLFGIKNVEKGMQQMLYLVWSSDKDKSERVAQAYKKIFFQTDQTGRAHALKVIKNLGQFMVQITVGHYAALEVLVKSWVESNDIDSTIIQVLFEIYTRKFENLSENEIRQALQLMVMISAAKPVVVTANMQLLEQIGFEERGPKDPRYYIGTLQLLINSIVPTTTASKFYKRYEVTTPKVQKVVELFQQFFFCKNITDFDEIGTKTFDFIYKMVSKPDILSKSILIDIHDELVKRSGNYQDLDGPLSQVPLSQIPSTQQPLSQNPVNDRLTQGTIRQSQSGLIHITLPIDIAYRFIYIVGYVAMRQMIYLDIDVYSNLKYRQELKEELKNKKKNHKGKQTMANRRATMSMDMSASNALKRLTGTPTGGPNDQEPEEDLVGATAEDTVAEQIAHICENEMLYTRDNLLSKLVPIVFEICKYPNKYKSELLQKAATLALIRFMAISSKFCEEYMPFLMNIYQHSKYNVIKSNIIIGLSDFTFRFPNVIEPWTKQMYSTLQEDDPELRLTAVKMLSHLILHEMIRVKGQISDLAMCIVDSVLEIQTITQQFFKEIANKSNILYNVLPDIISRLSDENLKLEEAKYHTIMKYIFSLIQKDKQIESLVEKLCLRFRVTNNERQWRDVAYCLSLLSYNEKTIKKLIDNIHCFKDKVQIEEIYDAFKAIINNTNKLAKPELKAVVTELENRIEECLAVNEEGEGAVGGSQQAGGQSQKDRMSSRAPKTASKPARGGRGRRNRRQTDSSDSGSDSENMPPPPAKNIGARAKQVSKKITKVIEDSDESSDEEEQPRPKKGRGRRR